MDTNTMADLVISMNPDNRLFIAKTDEPIFVDQRLIRLTRINKNANPELLHALLNSCISMFLIEAIGFGRGLGVLDINSTKISEGFLIPKLTLISAEDANNIIRAFQPLLEREALPVHEELKKMDRQEFDKTILRSIGISDEVLNKIYSALLTVYNIRKSVGR
jgi:DNA-directed RNA polymerase subunit H (RpoH/RPB5)